MKPLSRNGDSYSIHTTPFRGTYVSTKALETQIYAALHFWGIFSNIHAGEFQRERCILRTILAKLSFAFVFTSPLGHGRVFPGGEKLCLIKLLPQVG